MLTLRTQSPCHEEAVASDGEAPTEKEPSQLHSSSQAPSQQPAPTSVIKAALSQNGFFSSIWSLPVNAIYRRDKVPHLAMAKLWTQE